MKLPALQFYPGDWKRDTGVQSLSLHDRMVWFELLMLMHDSERRGFLLLNGKPMSEAAIARNIGMPIEDWRASLANIIDAGVPSYTDEGVMFNRRMVRDQEIREKKRAAGKLGGNPALKALKNKGAVDKQEDIHADNHAAKQKGGSSVSVSTSELNSPSPLRSEGEARRVPLPPPESGRPGSGEGADGAGVRRKQGESGRGALPASRRGETSVGTSKVVAMRGRIAPQSKNGGSNGRGGGGKAGDTRTVEFRTRITDFWAQANDRESNACPWGKAESSALSALLEASAMTAGDLQTCLDHRWLSIQSSCFPAGMRPAQWIASLPNFLSGPINQYGDLLTQKRGRVL